MGLFRDIARAATAGGAGAAAGGASGGTAAAGGTSADEESFGSKAGRIAKRAGKSIMESPKRQVGVDTGQYSVGSMGLAGSVPGQSSDSDFANGRRKRSNGKNRG